MNYFSSRDRNKNQNLFAHEAIIQGISTEGGLFVPEKIPQINYEFIEGLKTATYVERAIAILKQFLTDFTDEEIRYCVETAYNYPKFDSQEIAPISQLSTKDYVLELWHGPTCAFKDMALQLLPLLLTTSIKKSSGDKEIVILTATSGDTGKAALEGFKDIQKTKIIVFYPQKGVSEIQKLQMLTQEGKNTYVVGVEGNFDDAQSGVKKIFTDEKFKSELAEKNIMFSSANSINIGRLLPQIVYYFSGYADLLNDNKIKPNEKINVVVPTGNFGNILAAYYAKEMGLPINKLICASNENNVLTDFIKTGIYDKNREFKITISPSMDILISSNLERLLYHLSDDKNDVSIYMKSLTETGKYEVKSELKAKLNELFIGGYCDDTETIETIEKTYHELNYLVDTHTAVALNVLNKYREQSSDNTVALIASTASPFKFSEAVLKAISSDNYNFSSPYEVVEKLSEISHQPIPDGIKGLNTKKVLHNIQCETKDMKETIKKLL